MSSAPRRRIFEILLLEDSPADIYLLRQALKGAGLDFELTVIQDGADGLAFAMRQGKYEGSCIPDLAVLDLNVPKGGGESVLLAMRQSKDLECVPVVIMTSSAGGTGERAKAKDLGAAQFITKPLELEDFLQIGEVLKQILLKSMAAQITPEFY